MTRYVWAILVGLVGAGIGMAFFQFLLGGPAPINQDPAVSTAGIGLATFLTTSLSWGLCMAPGKASPPRGALVGALAVLLAHPLSFLVQAFISLARFGQTEAGWLSSVFYAGLASLVLAIFSLAITGIPSIMMGAITGALLGGLQRWFEHRSMQTSFT